MAMKTASSNDHTITRSDEHLTADLALTRTPNHHKENKPMTDATNTTDILDIPRHIGEESTYMAHGNRFRVKKLKSTVYYLENESGRARFGTRSQIKDDIRYTMASGALPPRSKNSGA
jgi:hypothetical protein